MTAWRWVVPPQSAAAFLDPMGGLWSCDPEALVDRAPAPSEDRHGTEMM